MEERGSTRIFVCRNCGNVVVVQKKGDKRTVFCSGHCARQYWRKPKSVQEKRARHAGEVEKALEQELEARSLKKTS